MMVREQKEKEMKEPFLFFLSSTNSICLSPALPPVHPLSPSCEPHYHLLSFSLMNEQWQAAKDVLVIVVADAVAVVTQRLRIHGIYSTTLSA